MARFPWVQARTEGGQGYYYPYLFHIIRYIAFLPELRRLLRYFDHLERNYDFLTQHFDHLEHYF